MMGSTVEDDTTTATGKERVDPAESPVVPPANAPNARQYTSIVYVHGIGNQRRYEETSRLIDQLDRYLFTEEARGDSKGRLRDIEVRVEPLRTPSKSEIVGYIETIFTGSPERPRRHAFRFYELYWAPVMADVKSPWNVLRWLFKQPIRPWRTAFSPWRERQRLRRASLVSLFEPGRTLPDTVEQRDCGRLLKLYDDFEGLPARRSYSRGTFREFLVFISAEEKNRPDRMKRHLVLARAWRQEYVFEEVRNALVLNSLALALLLLAAGALTGTYQLLQALVAALAISLSDLQISEADVWKTAAGIAAALAGLLGLGRALTDYVGDVEAWATYEETDIKHIARGKVLDQGMELLTHVLNDDGCNRAVVVAHSLGTSIALDTMLELRQRNLAHDSENPMSAIVRLDKIDHFVTMGSPIDKIEYFFESYCSTSHRFKRVVEALRGDIGSEPFSHAHIPQIHWINFWDEGDAISGQLHSPSGAELYLQRVDNVEVASFGFPDTGSSHAGYFSNRAVLAKLFEIIFQSGYSFWPLKTVRARTKEQYDELYLGPGKSPIRRGGWILVALAIPWLTLIGAVGHIFGLRALPIWLWGMSGTAAVALAIGFWVSRKDGQLDPIQGAVVANRMSGSSSQIVGT